MFGINKNGTKHKIGIIMPASYPASRITRESVSVTADGVKTWQALLEELYALLDTSKVTNSAHLVTDGNVFQLSNIGNGYFGLSSQVSFFSSPYFYNYAINVRASGAVYLVTSGNSLVVNKTGQVPTSGETIVFYYT